MGAQEKHQATQMTPKQRNVASPPWSPQSESTASTMESSSSFRTSNNSHKKPKKVQQRQEDVSKAEDLQAEINRLHRIQDRMEAYQSNLEKEHIIYQRQIEDMECSLQRLYTKLESWLEYTRLLNERLESQSQQSSEFETIVQHWDQL